MPSPAAEATLLLLRRLPRAFHRQGSWPAALHSLSQAFQHRSCSTPHRVLRHSTRSSSGQQGDLSAVTATIGLTQSISPCSTSVAQVSHIQSCRRVVNSLQVLRVLPLHSLPHPFPKQGQARGRASLKELACAGAGCFARTQMMSALEKTGSVHCLATKPGEKFSSPTPGKSRQLWQTTAVLPGTCVVLMCQSGGAVARCGSSLKLY